MLYLFIITTLLFWWILKGIEKRLNVKPKKSPHVNRIHKWGESLIAIISIIISVIMIFIFNESLKLHHIILILFFMSGFRTWTEWKFENDTKRYVISFLMTSYIFIYLVVLIII